VTFSTKVKFGLGGRHSTWVAFALHAEPARVQITAPEFLLMLIDSPLLIVQVDRANTSAGERRNAD